MHLTTPSVGVRYGAMMLFCLRMRVTIYKLHVCQLRLPERTNVHMSLEQPHVHVPHLKLLLTASPSNLFISLDHVCT